MIREDLIEWYGIEKVSYVLKWIVDFLVNDGYFRRFIMLYIVKRYIIL